MTDTALTRARYRVLLVDDEEINEEVKLEPLVNNSSIELVAVGSLEAAKVAISKEFFHLALIDLQLDAQDDDNIDGQYVLSELQEGRPSCRRILFTRTAVDHRQSLFELANPDGPLIHGALDKSDYGRDWVRWIRTQAAIWEKERLAVHGLSVLGETLDAGLVGKETAGGVVPAMTEDEIEQVISDLLKVGRGAAMDSSIDEVTLMPLPGPQGDSNAGVVLARCSSTTGGTTVTCVVKVAARDECKEECRRYESFARYRIAPERRAELLGSSLGDTVGAAAYAFAGRSHEEIGGVEAMFASEEDRALTIIDAMFGSDVDDLWRPINDAEPDHLPSDLGAYFGEAYGLNDKVGLAVEKYVENHLAELYLERDGDALKPLGPSGRPISLPTAQFLGGPQVRTSYRAGLVHGDLNARNILVAGEDKARLIDFRHARIGAVAVDFAALESSVRLATFPPRVGGNDYLADLYAIERKVIGTGWTERPDDRALVHLPYWGHVSVRLAQLSRACLEPLEKREYLATCLLYALRLFRVNDLGHDKHLRLVPWIAVLSSALGA